MLVDEITQMFGEPEGFNIGSYDTNYKYNVKQKGVKGSAMEGLFDWN